MKLSIIYPIKNRSDLFNHTLSSLKNTIFPKDELELIIVDVGSNDGLHELLLSYKDVFNIKRYVVDITKYDKYPLPKNRNTYDPVYCWNLGIKKSRGDYIILTSPEICPQGDILSILGEYIDGNTIFMGTVYNAVLKNNQYVKKVCYYGKERKDKIHSPGYCFFAAYPRSSLFDINGLEEKFMMGIARDDVDFGEVLIYKGYKHIIMDGIECWHLWHPGNYSGVNDPNYKINAKILDERRLLRDNGTFIKNNVDIDWGDDKYVIDSIIY